MAMVRPACLSGWDMCGRYASARKRQELLEEFQVQADHVAESLEADYNVAPTKPVYGVLARRERGSADGQATGQMSLAAAAGEPNSFRGDSDRPPVTRQLRVLRWGLVPSWAKDPSGRQQADQCPRGNGRGQARLQASLRPAALPASRRWLLRVAAGGRQSAAAISKQPFFMFPRGRERPRHGRALRAVAGARICPPTIQTPGSGRRRSSPPGPPTSSAIFMTGCRWS